MGYIYGGVDPDIIINGDGGGDKTTEAQSVATNPASKVTPSISEWWSSFGKNIGYQKFTTEGIESSIDAEHGSGSHMNLKWIDTWREENRESSDKLLPVLRMPEYRVHSHVFAAGLEAYSTARTLKDPQGMIAALADQLNAEQDIAKDIMSLVKRGNTCGNSKVL